MGVGLAYISCNYRQHNSQALADLISSLLKQLAQSQRPFPTLLKQLYKKHESSKTQPSMKELKATLYHVALSYERCFIVVDGLDEWQ